MPYENFAALYTKFLPFPSAGHFSAALSWYNAHTQGLLLCVIVLYSWMRRHRRSTAETGTTIAVVFCIFYAITSRWAFQYLAWLTPFLIFLGLPAALTLALFSSGYIWLFYSFVCQSLFLQGRWDLAGRPYLPGAVWLFRDLSVLSFAAVSLFFFCKSAFDRK